MGGGGAGRVEGDVPVPGVDVWLAIGRYKLVFIPQPDVAYLTREATKVARLATDRHKRTGANFWTSSNGTLLS